MRFLAGIVILFTIVHARFIRQNCYRILEYRAHAGTVASHIWFRFATCLLTSLFQASPANVPSFFAVCRLRVSCSLSCACCGHSSCTRWRSIARPYLKPSLTATTRPRQIPRTTSGCLDSFRTRCEPVLNRSAAECSSRQESVWGRAAAGG